MSTTLARRLFTAGLLSLCAAGLTVQAQTASPGPPSRNANVDKEDPNKPDTPKHEIPNQEAPGSGVNNEPGAAGQSTPTGGDGSAVTENRDPTQAIPRNSAEQNAAKTDKDTQTGHHGHGDSDQNRNNTDQNEHSETQDENNDTGNQQGTSASGQTEMGQGQPDKQVPPDPQR